MSAAAPSKQNILRLYKHLLKYGKQLQFTDKEYFATRIQKEFRSNKSLVESEDILFSYQVIEVMLNQRINKNKV